MGKIIFDVGVFIALVGIIAPLATENFFGYSKQQLAKRRQLPSPAKGDVLYYKFNDVVIKWWRCTFLTGLVIAIIGRLL